MTTPLRRALAAAIVDDPGATFTCTASQGEATRDVTATIKDLDGTVSLSF